MSVTDFSSLFIMKLNILMFSHVLFVFTMIIFLQKILDTNAKKFPFNFSHLYGICTVTIRVEDRYRVVHYHVMPTYCPILKCQEKHFKYSFP